MRNNWHLFSSALINWWEIWLHSSDKLWTAPIPLGGGEEEGSGSQLNLIWFHESIVIKVYSFGAAKWLIGCFAVSYYSLSALILTMFHRAEYWFNEISISAWVDCYHYIYVTITFSSSSSSSSFSLLSVLVFKYGQSRKVKKMIAYSAVRVSFRSSGG